jgi:drug/metabolite transporter (DMT)-like permease
MRSAERVGWLWGALGVLGFSLTLPATRVAVPWLGPLELAGLRALCAGIVAAACLAATRVPFPRRELGGLALVSAGVVLGFPWLSAWALVRLPASHGAVMLAVLPLATAGAAAWRAGERPSARFWLASLGASLTISGYALLSGGGRPHPADLALLGAALAAALGYAEGGRLSRSLGPLAVIGWSLVLALPAAVALTLLAPKADVTRMPAVGWASLLYVSVGSQFAAFLAWYRGLAVGGVARVGQLQYLQVFLTLLASHVLLGERLGWATVVAAGLVVAAVACSRAGAPDDLRASDVRC